MIAEMKKPSIAQVITLSLSLSSGFGGVMAHADVAKSVSASSRTHSECMGYEDETMALVDLFKGNAVQLTSSLRSLCIALVEDSSKEVDYEALESVADSLRKMEQDFRHYLQTTGDEERAHNVLVESGVMRSLAKARSQAAMAAMLAKQKATVPETYDGHVSSDAFRHLAAHTSAQMAHRLG